MRRWPRDGRAQRRWRRPLCVALVLAAAPAGGAGLEPSAALAQTGAEPELRVRKSVAALNASERRRYVEAVLELKSTPSPYRPGVSWYDQFVAWHVDLARCNPADPLAEGMMMGHGGPVFLPWHRQFLLMFEDALRTVSGRDVTVPYWDWSDPASTPALLADDFMGGDGNPDEGYAVTSGPFRRENWPLVVQNVGLEWSSSATTYLARHIGSLPGTEALPAAADDEEALAAPAYDVAPYSDASDHHQSFRNALEGFRNHPGPSSIFCGPDGILAGFPLGEGGLHNLVHAWVGGTIGAGPEGVKLLGTLTVPLASPNDPIFFLIHSNTDRLWARWQEAHGTDSYQPVSGFPHNEADDPMFPYEEAGLSVTPADLGDVRALGYTYHEPSAPRLRARRELICRVSRS